MSRHQQSAFVLLAFGLLALGSVESEERVTESVAEQSVSYRVSAAQLAKEYDDNEVAADAKYEDKVIIVTGSVESIGKDITDTPYITLEGQGFLAGVQCMFKDASAARLARLSKGDRVSVKGKVAGKTIGNVLLRGCSLQ